MMGIDARSVFASRQYGDAVLLGRKSWLDDCRTAKRQGAPYKSATTDNGAWRLYCGDTDLVRSTHPRFHIHDLQDRDQGEFSA